MGDQWVARATNLDYISNTNLYFSRHFRPPTANAFDFAGKLSHPNIVVNQTYSPGLFWQKERLSDDILQSVLHISIKHWNWRMIKIQSETKEMQRKGEYRTRFQENVQLF